MSREAAGAAIRTLREARDWSLADLAEATGVSIMGLSFLERGARKPHKSTVQKVENGLGVPPGTYARLVVAEDTATEVAELLSPRPAPSPVAAPGPVVVTRKNDTVVFEGYAEAQIEALKALIDRLPAPTSNEYETYIRNVVAQCVKAELLTANSWRVAVNAGADADGPLLAHVHALESIRAQLMGLLPASLSSQFDRACATAALPETVIAALLGITTEQLWDIRNQGPVPAGALARIRAFATTAGAAIPGAALS